MPSLPKLGISPTRGGDRLSLRLSLISSDEQLAPPPMLPISPLVGEMPGRAEGGAIERQPQ
ncbi:MAG: lytic murein transglycosylase [Mesorhizobium sp.]|nr:MAG: lytic murein transglycosylase [Mesorhizobium sp.]